LFHPTAGYSSIIDEYQAVGWNKYFTSKTKYLMQKPKLTLDDLQVESFVTNLNADEQQQAEGGTSPWCIASVVIIASAILCPLPEANPTSAMISGCKPCPPPMPPAPTVPAPMPKKPGEMLV
jgi:hypothetical protein